jgi:hypothetical protein
LRAIAEHRAGQTITLPNGKTFGPQDHFCDGYVPELDKVVDDPGAKCMSEESHLQSWIFGDEGKLVHRDQDGKIVVDTDSMIAKTYRGDPLRYHLVHPAPRRPTRGTSTPSAGSPTRTTPPLRVRTCRAWDRARHSN